MSISRLCSPSFLGSNTAMVMFLLLPAALVVDANVVMLATLERAPSGNVVIVILSVSCGLPPVSSV